MKMRHVNSSAIAAIGYDGDTATLRIRFIDSGTYDYYRVAVGVYEGLLRAPSKGNYFDRFIRKGGYSYNKVSTGDG